MNLVEMGVAIGIVAVTIVTTVAVFGGVAYIIIGTGASMLRRMRENRR